MSRAPHVAVIYYSRNGTVHALARAAAAGAGAGGAHVRLLRVEGDQRPGGAKDDLRRVPVATHEDLRWADGVVLGTPTYFGNIASPLKQFIDSTSDLWREGALADRVVTGITSSNSPHGGRESTLLALYQSMYHWGALIMSAGHTDGAFTVTGANPYGVSAPSDPDGTVGDAHLRAAQALGLRLSRGAARMAGPGHPGSGHLGPSHPERRPAETLRHRAGPAGSPSSAIRANAVPGHWPPRSRREHGRRAPRYGCSRSDPRSTGAAAARRHRTTWSGRTRSPSARPRS